MKSVNVGVPLLLLSSAFVASVGACGDDDNSVSSTPDGGADVQAGDSGPGPDVVTPPAPQARPGLALVPYTSMAQGGKDGVLSIDLDPESDKFGEIVSKKELGPGVIPHHFYFNNAKTKLYLTSVGPMGKNLYSVGFTRDAQNVLSFGDITPIDVGTSVVGENMFFLKNDSKFYLTFMGGQPGVNDGSIGVFDGTDNKLLKTISAKQPDTPATLQDGGTLDPAFILYPHGISASEEIGTLAVTSTLPPDPTSKMPPGNTVTTIDLATDTIKSTYLVSPSTDAPTAPIEVLITRNGLPSFVIATTFATGDMWVAPWDDTNKTFGAFVKQVDGTDAKQGGGLQTYIHESKAGVKELFVAFGQPGSIKVYGLDKLPALPLNRTITTAAGTHHLAFFQTKSGREVVAAENNLLNIKGFDTGTITLHDIATGELLKTLDLKSQQMMVQTMESAYGTGYFIHH